MKILLLSIFSLAFSQYNYSLQDENSSSNYYQQFVGPSYFDNQITMHYFGSFTWGLCGSRFAQLNNVYENLINNNYTQVKLFGIGYGSQSNYVGNWANSNQFSSICHDEPNNSTFSSWGASQRDFYILDHEGNLVLEQNISSGLPSNLESIIINLINNIPSQPECNEGDTLNDNPCSPAQCINGTWNELIIDCPEQTGIPCGNGLYLSPSENECCSICTTYGDLNSDSALNVSDVVLIINLILTNQYSAIADINSDSTLNVTDVVLLINTIIS